MKKYLDCWKANATTLFAQALAGEPRLIEEKEVTARPLSGVGFIAHVSGGLEGDFAIALDPSILETPLLGDGVDQAAAWEELLREVSDAAAGELLAASGIACRTESLIQGSPDGYATSRFQLITHSNRWTISIRDDVQSRRETEVPNNAPEQVTGKAIGERVPPGSGVDLLLDVELDAALRFGCCEMPLGEILELGPGDVIELDRHISDPVDLIVGDKIVARGDVVLVNGNFGLRVTEVAEPRKRLEGIRCLF